MRIVVLVASNKFVCKIIAGDKIVQNVSCRMLAASYRAFIMSAGNAVCRAVLAVRERRPMWGKCGAVRQLLSEYTARACLCFRVLVCSVCIYFVYVCRI